MNKSEKRKQTMIARFMDEYDLTPEEAEDLYLQWHKLIAGGVNQQHSRHFDNPKNAAKAAKRRWGK